MHPVMLENIELCGYEAPTPIQKYTLPAIHKGLDVVAIAQTGKFPSVCIWLTISNVFKKAPARPQLTLFPS